MPVLVAILAVDEGDKTGTVPQFGRGFGSTTPLTVMSPLYLTTSYSKNVGFEGQTYSNSFGKKSSDGKTIYWYSDSEYASRQMNYSGYKYYWMAIG